MLRLLIIVNLAIFSVYLMANRLWAMRPYLLIHISIISMKWPINPKPHFRIVYLRTLAQFSWIRRSMDSILRLQAIPSLEMELKSSTDQSVIASTINDTCDGTQSFGLVTFWPWFISEYVVGEGVPVSYTFDYTGCASIDSAVSYQLPTSSPTTAPTTADPTDAPTTADPTNAPTTADPTRYPTRDPTAPPTTADPTTAEPTYNPTTSSPTTTAEATTANPSNSPSTVDQIVYSTEATEATELDVYGDSRCERAACFVCVLVVFFAFSFLY
eukprot:881330_1